MKLPESKNKEAVVLVSGSIVSWEGDSNRAIKIVKSKSIQAVVYEMSHFV